MQTSLVARYLIIATILALCSYSLMAVANNASADDLSVNWQLGSSPLATHARSIQPLDGNNSEHELWYKKSVHLSAAEVVAHVEEVTYYPTAVAVQNANNNVVQFEAGVDSLIITEAAVLSETNSISRFEPASAVISDTDTYDVFTDDREVVIALPGLAPGAKSLLAYTRVTKREGLQMAWATSIYPQLGYARRHVELEFTWDPNVPAPAWHNAFTGFNCVEAPQKLHCIANDIEPAKEDSDVSYYDVWPQLQVSTTTRWEDVIQHELPGIEAAIEDTTLLDTVYDELDESPSDPVAPLWEYSATKIRYVSFSAGEHSVQPHKISKTITDLYGDCKDKSMVLLALLRKQGVKASAALVATNKYEPELLKVPAGHYFNHMVVCLQDDNGAVTRCLDPTDSNASSKGTTRGIQGNVALLLAPGSSPFAIPQDTYRWEIDVNTHIVFDEKGNQTETIERTYPGNYGGWFRSRLAARTDDERNEWLLDNYHSNVSNSADPSITLDGIERLESSISITTRANFEDVVDPEKNLDYREALAWIADLVRTFKVKNEHYYYDFPGTKVTSRYRFELPAIWQQASPGATVDLKTEYGSFTRRNTVEANNIVQVSDLELPARRLSVVEFERFNRFLTAILDTSRMYITASSAKK